MSSRRSRFVQTPQAWRIYWTWRGSGFGAAHQSKQVRSHRTICRSAKPGICLTPYDFDIALPSQSPTRDLGIVPQQSTKHEKFSSQRDHVTFQLEKSRQKCYHELLSEPIALILNERGDHYYEMTFCKRAYLPFSSVNAEPMTKLRRSNTRQPQNGVLSHCRAIPRTTDTRLKIEQKTKNICQCSNSKRWKIK